MRRRPCLAALAALCSLVFVIAGCSGDDEPDADATTTEAGATTEADDGSTTTAPEAEDAAVDCDAFHTVTGLFASLEEIASGNNEAQVAADETLATAIAALAPAAEGDDIVSGAVEILGQVSFQVTEADDGPSVDEIDGALVTIEDAWSSQCTGPIECPAPETLEAEGLQCDAEGNVTPLEMEDGGGEVEQPECPAPEVLEAEGFSCDSEGNLTPVDEETVGECPSPEVLEAEGFSCDSEGNLTPVEGSDGAEDPAPEDEPVECPAPEVLEAEGYTCDSEGNLTPA